MNFSGSSITLPLLLLIISMFSALSSPGSGGRARLLPEAMDNEYQRPAPTLVRSKGHHREWLDARKGGPSPSSNFEYGAALTEVGCSASSPCASVKNSPGTRKL